MIRMSLLFTSMFLILWVEIRTGAGATRTCPVLYADLQCSPPQGGLPGSSLLTA